MGYFYLGLAFLGAVAPYSFMGQFLLTHGWNVAEFKVQLWASPISSFVGAAFLIASLVNLFFIINEGRRLKMKGLWLPIVANLAVGVSCGLPLFLYLRDLALIRQQESGPAQPAGQLPAGPR